MNRKYSKTESFEQIKALVNQFDVGFSSKKNLQKKEAQLEDKYIKPLFSYLNWNIHNEGLNRNREEFRVQTSHKIKKTTKEPDYELWLPDNETKRMKRHLFMEAKDPKYDLSKEVGYIRQAYQYAHSTLNLSDHSFNRTRLSLLTDFEEFRLFDCLDPYPLTKNDAAIYNKHIVKPFDFDYKNYISDFNLLWDAFERNNVLNGSLKEFQVTDDELKKNRIAPDLKFLDNLKEWREKIAKSMFNSNKNITDEFLTSASQIMINRIIFLKMLTDREIEHDYLTLVLEKLKNDKEELSIYESCRSIFEDLNKKYNGDIFKKREEFDHVIIENSIFKEIIDNLKPEKSVYTLSAMPVEIIGNAYEQFLGEVVVHKGRGIKTEKKPEVNKADGVFYTPRYIVDYIVEHTVGTKLKKANTPNDASKIKILDPACGSGSFLIRAYEALLDWHTEYYKTQIDEMLKNGKTEYEINKKYRDVIKYYQSSEEGNNYIIHLTSKLKKNILLNNIHGVDIDENAVEITRFSLSMKALENATRDEVVEDIDFFNEQLLPNLEGNIKCGNSIIGTNFYKDSQIELFTDQERKKINVFDWNAQGVLDKATNTWLGRGFPDIMKIGGFDCVIGNPPYVRQESLSSSKEYLQQYYNSYQGTADLYVYFIEKGFSLLSNKGLFGYIVANKWLKAGYGENLRNYLSKKAHIYSIIDFGELPVFGASTDPLILILEKTTKKKNAPIKFAKLRNKIELSNFIDNFSLKINNIPKSQIERNEWMLIRKENLDIIEKIKECGVPLDTFVSKNIFRGILTGYNEAFKISEDTKNDLIKQDPKSMEIIKPFLSGKEIRRYWYMNKNEFLIFTRRGINIKNYPAVHNYLTKFKKQLQPKPKNWKGSKWEGRKTGPYEWYEIQDTIAYFEKFDDTKIVFNETSKELHAFLDVDKLYINKTGFIITCEHNEYLLGILNSKLFDFYYRNTFPSWGNLWAGGRVQFRGNLMAQLPIIDTNLETKDKVKNLVQMISDAYLKLNDSRTLMDKKNNQDKINLINNQLNQIVYKLYNITNEEIDIIEKQYN